MKSLTPFFQGILRHHFWVLCGAIAPLLMGSWFTTTAWLQQETDDRVSKIDTRYKAANDLRTLTNHPNTISQTGMDGFIDQVKEEVYGAWDQQYRRQQDILVWPPELGSDFISQVQKYQPAEKFEYQLTPDLTKELPRTDRDNYRNYIKKELPKLAKTVRAEWSAAGATRTVVPAKVGLFGAFDAGAGASGQVPVAAAAAVPEEAIQIVTWDQADQSKQSRRFDWANTTDKTPRTVDILYAQEDLWVLQALMKIIAAANSDATGTYNATVREILSIQLGSEVGKSSGTIGSGSAADAASAWDAMWGVEPSGGGGRSGGGTSQSMLTTRAGGDPADRRYVDTEYDPIPAEDLRAIINSDWANQPPDNAYLFVAKRVPIRLKLKVDSRRISRFIAACGNSDLMVEVRQVRINSEAAGATGGGFGGDDAESMMGVEQDTNKGDDQTSGFEELGGSATFGGSGVDPLLGALAGMEIEEEEPEYVLPVEFYGMVYIYNPVDAESLDVVNRVEAEPDPAAATDPAEVAQPAEPTEEPPAAATDPAAPATEPAPAADDAQPAE